MKSAPNTSLLMPHFKKFVNGFKESPSDEFFQSVLAFSDLIDQLGRYLYFKKNAPQPIYEPNGNTSESPDQVLFSTLKKKFSNFDSAFSETPLNVAKQGIPDSQVDNQMESFRDDWIKQNRAGRSVDSQWKVLHQRVLSLKQIIDGRTNFEVDLQSSQSIRIVKISKNSELATGTTSVISEGPMRAVLSIDLQARK